MIVKEAALPTDYGRWIQTVKDRVREAQLRTMVAANVEQLLLYWDIGHDILERQKNEGWGAKIIPRISNDLISEFPHAQGFSPRNLGYMKRFAASWPRKAILQAPLAKLPWFSQIALAGQERTLDVGGDAFRLDLLFYNVRIHRYFVIEIKTRKFKPQDVGQLGFYMTAIDEQVRDKEVEGNTVGILLCKSRNRIVVEYALKNVNQPIAVSTYELEKMGLASPKAITDGLVRILENNSVGT